MPSRPWLPKVRHLLGELSDQQVAIRAGVAQTTVMRVRLGLGIPAMRGRTLASYSADDVKRLVRARAKSGRSMHRTPRDDGRLATLCRYHFGCWYQAVAAAGLKPEGVPDRKVPALPNAKLRPLTPALLQGPKSTAELERLTGVARGSVRHRRRLLGIKRNERREPDRSWVAGVRAQLGVVSDADIARRVGVAQTTLGIVRSELGILKPPLKSMATSSEVGERLRRMSKAELRSVLAGLEPMDRKIIEARYLRARPVTLAELGKRLGISRQRVAQRERRAVALLDAASIAFTSRRLHPQRLSEDSPRPEARRISSRVRKIRS